MKRGDSSLQLSGPLESLSSDDAAGCVCVMVAVPSSEVGTTLARALVSSRAAACVQVVPGVTSYYEWQGKMEESAEQLLLIKSRRSLLPQIADVVKAHHPYDTPELIALPVEAGSRRWLDWLRTNTGAQ